MDDTLSNLRQDYNLNGLTEDRVAADPIDQFQTWFDAAREAGVREPNAMTLATVNADGEPAARVVLLKQVDADGFVFYTNYTSRKGREIETRACVALVFWWEPLERQVRIEGEAERVAAAQSDAYFNSRPRGSRLGALASDQSRAVPDRATLDRRLAGLEREYADTEAIPRPHHWGGYRVHPSAIEFWQGRRNRMHDRLRYTRTADGWRIQRLAP